MCERLRSHLTSEREPQNAKYLLLLHLQISRLGLRSLTAHTWEGERMGRHDVSDERWQLIEEFLHIPNARTGRPRMDLRQAFNGIVWVLKTGAAWRDLDSQYGSWSSVYRYFRIWQGSGAFDKIQSELCNELERKGHLDHSQWNIGGTCIRASKAAAGASKKNTRRNLPIMLLAALEADLGAKSIS